MDVNISFDMENGMNVQSYNPQIKRVGYIDLLRAYGIVLMIMRQKLKDMPDAEL